jgi:hypothetical protein
MQRTSLGDGLKYEMSMKSEKSTVIQLAVVKVAHLKGFRTLKIGLTRMGT